MNTSQLSIDNLYVSVEGNMILKGLSLTIKTNEIHAIMGPNGNGKSTLLSTIMGHPKYKVESGSILLDGQNVLEMSVDQRSRAGIFLAMQYPQEVPGVTNSDFLKQAVNARLEKPVSLIKFMNELDSKVQDLQMKEDLAHRFLNEGFSGGEKKRNEILQMSMLKPKFALIDEIDSGLDVDALRIVSQEIKKMKCDSFGALIVSHYERFFELVQPTHVHVLIDGKIVLTGGYELVEQIDQSGYDSLIKKESEFDMFSGL